MAEQTIRLEKTGALKRIFRSKRLLIVLATAVAVPVVWLSEFRSAAEAPVACDVQYDTLVKQAKQQLIDGDRPAAISSLIAARKTLRDCETPTAKDVAPIWRN